MSLTETTETTSVKTYPISAEQSIRLQQMFSYHTPKETQPEKYTMIRKAALDLGMLLQTLCPQSRELSLAITKLEETVMHANSAIARNE